MLTHLQTSLSDTYTLACCRRGERCSVGTVMYGPTVEAREDVCVILG